VGSNTTLHYVIVGATELSFSSSFAHVAKVILSSRFSVYFVLESCLLNHNKNVKIVFLEKRRPFKDTNSNYVSF
jgi:hypothetical protein